MGVRRHRGGRCRRNGKKLNVCRRTRSGTDELKFCEITPILLIHRLIMYYYAIYFEKSRGLAFISVNFTV